MRGTLITVVAAVVLSGCTSPIDSLTHHAIPGSPRANPAGVAQAALERKEAADKAAAAAKAAAEEASIRELEDELQESMQKYFDDPANDLNEEHIRVSGVSLVKLSNTNYEGMAKMSAGGGSVRSIVVHVTADDRTVMWTTDQGGLLPLFR